MSDLFSTLFNGEGLKINPTQSPEEDSNQFRPRFSKGQNKRYEAIIRFLPNPEDPLNKSIISKWTVFLKDPRNNQGQSIDSPSSVGEQDPLTQMFFNLRNSTDKSIAKFSEDFKRHQRYYSLVQVIENKNEPKTVGKIMVWCYGPKVFEKIQQEQTPEMQGVEPNRPFDLFTGRLFKVVATEASGFNNLDQSKFLDSVTYPNNCMRVEVPATDPTTGAQIKQFALATREMASTPEGQQLIGNYLTTNAPSLIQFEYKPWTKEQKDYVNEMITLHSQILNGLPISAPQQNAQVNQMANTQSATPMMASTMPMNNGMATGIPTGMPNMGSTPTVAPSLGNILGGTPSPQAAPAASNPLAGLSLGADINTPVTPGVPNMGGVSGLNTNSLDAIMGVNVTPQTAPTPTGGLGAILEGVIA